MLLLFVFIWRLQQLKNNMAAKLTRSWILISNFMHQLDLATMCLDIWSNITLDMSVKSFPGDINFVSVD